ncbi:PREDICTED: guanylate kinase-associated protein mars-like isoform X2 [Priapulus caudatus]|uniref:Guanylate kinase-associated protein mars-like isoform X2 n=1 Tax=Priapulus caudatus TaxID=37621 RepID=A0ABM1DV81_PRICU|nr:PREDICTED: guanylate kinase-associated protein mars-like isoform X2 [Priapulus caudatus]
MNRQKHYKQRSEDDMRTKRVDQKSEISRRQRDSCLTQRRNVGSSLMEEDHGATKENVDQGPTKQQSGIMERLQQWKIKRDAQKRTEAHKQRPIFKVGAITYPPLGMGLKSSKPEPLPPKHPANPQKARLPAMANKTSHHRNKEPKPKQRTSARLMQKVNKVELVPARVTRNRSRQATKKPERATIASKSPLVESSSARRPEPDTTHVSYHRGETSFAPADFNFTFGTSKPFAFAPMTPTSASSFLVPSTSDSGDANVTTNRRCSTPISEVKRNPRLEPVLPSVVSELKLEASNHSTEKPDPSPSGGLKQSSQKRTKDSNSKQRKTSSVPIADEDENNSAKKTRRHVAVATVIEQSVLDADIIVRDADIITPSNRVTRSMGRFVSECQPRSLTPPRGVHQSAESLELPTQNPQSRSRGDDPQTPAPVNNGPTQPPGGATEKAVFKTPHLPSGKKTPFSVVRAVNRTFPIGSSPFVTVRPRSAGPRCSSSDLDEITDFSPEQLDFAEAGCDLAGRETDCVEIEARSVQDDEPEQTSVPLHLLRHVGQVLPSVEESPCEVEDRSNGSTTHTETSRSVQYFKDLLVSEALRLEALCQHANDVYCAVTDLSEDLQGQIRTVVGQGQLLMQQRFKQFAGLLHNCEFGLGEKETTCGDLQGFWDMIYFQVEDVNEKFSNLEQLHAKGWKSETPKPKLLPKKKKTAGTRTGAAQKDKKASAASVAARARIAAARIAARREKKQEPEHANEQPPEAKSSPYSPYAQVAKEKAVRVSSMQSPRVMMVLASHARSSMSPLPMSALSSLQNSPLHTSNRMETPCKTPTIANVVPPSAGKHSVNGSLEMPKSAMKDHRSPYSQTLRRSVRIMSPPAHTTRAGLSPVPGFTTPDSNTDTDEDAEVLKKFPNLRIGFTPKRFSTENQVPLSPLSMQKGGPRRSKRLSLLYTPKKPDDKENQGIDHNDLMSFDSPMAV